LISKRQANAIYDLLIEKCEAPSNQKEDFVAVVCEYPDPVEYRFQGALGFGGKFFATYRWYVSAYPESMTPERSRMIEETNQALLNLHRGWLIEMGKARRPA
jgi:hypothetical protein